LHSIVENGQGQELQSMNDETELDLTIDPKSLEFHYGAGVQGPQPEFRTLDAIRASLLDPTCSGPNQV
jgi:glucose-6-phosphate isomerase